MRIPRLSALVLALTTLGLLAGFAAAARVADPVAVLVQITGAVQVQKAGQRTPVAATPGMQLAPGDRVIVPAGGRAVLLHKSGKMETATTSVTIAEPQTRQSAGLFSQTVSTLTKVATTDARTQPNRQGMIRPIAGAAVPISPRNGIKVLGLRPRFVWFRIPDAQAYTVQLRRLDGPCAERPARDRPAFCEPARFETGPDTVWGPSRMDAPLIPGAKYEWAVAAVGGRVSEPHRFQVIGGQDYAALSEALNNIVAGGIDPATDGLFLAALTYRELGLFYEARNALERLEALGMAHGRAYHTLRGEVFDALGDLAAAEREFQLADAEPTT
ncbi:MAG: hypothetical protein HY561_11145 [Gemmatimonadetes bacterium]|nr:hypothetical protein [Gemmatimonadota bacterium]